MEISCHMTCTSVFSLEKSHISLITGEKAYKFEEFIPVYTELISEKDTGTFADFMEAFKTFDREGQGFISGAELRHVLSSLGGYKNIGPDKRNV